MRLNMNRIQLQTQLVIQARPHVKWWAKLSSGLPLRVKLRIEKMSV